MSKYSNTRLIKPSHSQPKYIDTGDLSNQQKPKFYNNILNYSVFPAKKHFHTQTIPFESSTNTSNRKEIDLTLSHKNPFITFVNDSKLESINNVHNNINNSITSNSFPKNKKSLTNSYEKFIKDEKFFYLHGKKHKKFVLPQKKYKLNEYTFVHDINDYNRKYVIKDHTVNYAHDAYRVRQLYEKDNFVNMIKNDLFSLKFSNRLKAFSNL